MKKYKVTMWSPLYAVVEAKNKDEAIQQAMEDDCWEGPCGSGFEKFDVKITKDKSKIYHDLTCRCYRCKAGQTLRAKD